MKKYAMISLGSLLVLILCFQNFTRAKNGTLNRDERIEARELLIKIANWLQTPTEHSIETSEGPSTEVRRYGFSRKLMYVRSLENPEKTENYVSEALSSKICNTLEFLIALGKSRSVAFDARVPVRRYADLLVDNFQVKKGVWKGGFMLSENEGSLSTKTTSNCGMALLKSWEFLESHKPAAQRSVNSPYLIAAKRAASFLNKMRRPNLIPGLEDFVYLDNEGNPLTGARGFYLDGVDSKGLLRVAATLWNAEAIAFLEKLDSIVPGSSKISQRLRDDQIAFYVRGGMLVSETFMPKFQVRAQKKITLQTDFPGFKNTFQDNRWHRRYEGTTEMVGSDPVEYVIVAMNEMGRTAEERKLFDRYSMGYPLIKNSRNILSRASSTSDFDPFIGWTGFIVAGSLNADKEYRPSPVTGPYFPFTYYDFDAITHESKAKFYPCNVQAAVKKLLIPDTQLAEELMDPSFGYLSRWLYASLKSDLKPFGGSDRGGLLNSKELSVLNSNSDGVNWRAPSSTQGPERVMRYSKGTSTAIHNGLLLLHALEYADANRSGCN